MKTVPILFGIFLGASQFCLGILAETEILSNYEQLIRGTRQVGSDNETSALPTPSFSWDTNATTLLDPMRAQEIKNKQAVLGLMKEFFGDKDIESAGKYISSEKYIQHNPGVADGLHAVKTSAKDWFKGAKKETMDIRRISAEDDLVWVHYKAEDDGKPAAIVDIFRFENGKIVEHWDVIQKIPDHSANDHPMF